MKKFLSYLKALFFVMATILVFAGTKYDKLTTSKDLILSSFISGNLAIW